MTEVYELLKVAEDGTVEEAHTGRRAPVIAVKSTDVAPKGLPIYTQVFCVDKFAVAICDGEDKWYSDADTYITAGQTWAELF